MDRSDVDSFEKICGQLTGVYDEISLLSKKSPNDAVNKFKLKFVNRLVVESNAFLASKGNYCPYDDFTGFDEDDMPQNSDVVFILSQYLQCFEKLRADHVVRKSGMWFWALIASENDVADSKGMVYLQTVTPKGLRE